MVSDHIIRGRNSDSRAHLKERQMTFVFWGEGGGGELWIFFWGRGTGLSFSGGCWGGYLPRCNLVRVCWSPVPLVFELVRFVILPSQL